MMDALKDSMPRSEVSGSCAATRCKIVLAYHKPSLLLENAALQPLHVGRALTDYDLGIPGDDTGDNISQKNIHYAELTASYWAWKNLDDADYIGLFHYRRLLDLSGRIDIPAFDLPLSSQEEILSRLALDERTIAARCAGQDIVTRRIQDLHEWSNHSIYSHYATEHTEDHLHLTHAVMRHHDPADAEAFQNMLQGSVGYYTNMVVMRREVFDEYCSWLFNILEEVEQHVNLYERRFQKFSKYARIFGFLGERLTSYFILKSRAAGLSVSEFPAASLVPGSQDRWYNFNTYDLNSYDTGHRRLKHPPTVHSNAAKPLVSVVMPVYNCEPVLVSTVRSVLDQSVRNIELIAVDDGSRDGSLAILQDLARSDSRVQVLTQSNQGPGVTRNTGLQKARGEYVHFMDGDDRMDSTFLEELVGKAQHFDAEMVISSNRCFHSATGTVIADISLPHTVLAEECTNVLQNQDLLLVPGHLWDKLFRRDFISQFPFTSEGGEDLWVFWRALAAARRVAISKEVLFNYRVSEQSVQSNHAYALSVFKTAAVLVNFLNQHPQRDTLQPYFPLFLRLLLLHMLNRNRLSLEADENYRRHFHAKMAEIVELAGPVSPDLTNKSLFFGTDCASIDLIATLPYDTWWAEVRSVVYRADAPRWSSPLAFYGRALMGLNQLIEERQHGWDEATHESVIQARQTLGQLYQMIAATNERCRLAEMEKWTLLNSSSWRATAPLRKVRGYLRQAKGRCSFLLAKMRTLVSSKSSNGPR